MFVVNQVSLKGKPKRILLSQKSKMRRKSIQKGEYFSETYYVPPKESLARMAKFKSEKRFKEPSSEDKLLYKQKLAESKPSSDFEPKEPRGVKFGKERLPVSYQTYPI